MKLETAKKSLEVFKEVISSEHYNLMSEAHKAAVADIIVTVIELLTRQQMLQLPKHDKDSLIILINEVLGDIETAMQIEETTKDK